MWRIKPSRPRRGVSLIETLVVMTLSFAVLGTISVTMYSALRLEEHFRGAVGLSAAIGRFAVQFRSDAHDAAQTSLRAIDDSERSELVFVTGEDSEVVYRPVERGVTRSAFRQGERIHFDTLKLDKRFQVHFELAEQEAFAMAALVVSERAGAGVERYEPSLRIEGAALKGRK